jgi:hypothetical protein
MISGAGFPDSLAGGTLHESEASAAVGNHPFNIAGFAPNRVDAEWNVHPFKMPVAPLRAGNRTAVVNGTIDAKGFHNGAGAYVWNSRGETLKLIGRTNS